MSDDANEISPHSEKQEEIIFSDCKDTVAVTGTQFGKSQAGALWMKIQAHTFTDPKDNFLMTAPSYKIMQQSMLPYFLDSMRGFGEYVKSDACFKIHSGGTVFLRTNTDPDSIVGIPNVRAYWGDEAGKYTLYFWENIRARVASKGARTLLTTSPYTMNWLWRDIIKPKLDGKLPDIKLIRAASWENPYHSLHDPKVRFSEEARMDPRRFAMIYGGEFGKMQGLVFDCWDDDENYVQPFELPMGTRYIAGVDWGFNPDPFVIKVRAITPDGTQYGISEFYKTRLTPSDQIKAAQQKKQLWPIERFVCDPSNPAMIEEFNRNGLTAIKAVNDIKMGIGAHYDLIKARKYKEFIGTCPNSRDERETYHYPEPKDLGPDDRQKELLPVDANNHCFSGETLITTDQGLRQISAIQTGDLVLTRNGYRRVLMKWENGIQATIKAKFSNGETIVCTPNHKIFTKEMGFVSVSKITKQESLMSLQRSASLNLMGSSISDTLMQKTKGLKTIIGAAQSTMAKALDTFTGICLLILLERYQRATMFIMSMATRSTMTFQTYQFCPTWSTNLSMRGKHQALRDSGTSTRLGLRPQLGINQKRDELGTVNTQRTLKGFGVNTLVRSVKNIFKAELSRRVVSNFVAQTARPLHLEGVEVSSHVQVFDLSIENDHEYFANGVLVSNCMDVDRYLTLEARTFIKEPRLKPMKSTNPFDAILKGNRNSHTENFS